MAYKNKKLLEQFRETSGKAAAPQEDANLFRGVSIFVNGLTTPSHLARRLPADCTVVVSGALHRQSTHAFDLRSLQELKQIMALHGGCFVNYYSRDTVTHIICSNLTDQKLKLFAKERCGFGNFFRVNLLACCVL